MWKPREAYPFKKKFGNFRFIFFAILLLALYHVAYNLLERI